ncbi:hypothetical protein C8Q78DRAFT_1072069 [Trametes maxima]|nr:hypothetical protein C8Q78DRAFT_1072069 [Trametes maxima]
MYSPQKNQNGICTLAFATSTEVFHISPISHGAPCTGRRNLAHILDGSLSILAGFGMTRLALHLHHQWGLPVQGIDLSTLLAKESLMQIRAAQKVNTSLLDESHLTCLSKLFLNVELLEVQRPTQMDMQFDGVAAGKDGRLIMQNTRYKTRVRKSANTSIIMETSHGQQVVGHAVHAEGKRTGVHVIGGFCGTVQRIRVVGREPLTHAELACEEFILLLLQGVLPSLTRSPYICMFWFSGERAQQRGCSPLLAKSLGPCFSHINTSQRQVVAAMLSQDGDPLVIVHGPPETGKTTTIAAALDFWMAERKPTWIIAQSNVGIKNVARTLVKYDIDFRLLVSKEFYVEWHEDLYTVIGGCLVRSHKLFGDPVSAERKIGSSSIILCTISMLLNPAIDNCRIFRLVPVERLVVDEASQIDTLEFMQLPPHGKDTTPDMKTVYDFKQFKAAAYFLNTQYRMPVPLHQENLPG